jgi:apolipoprotein N-acyltransferase
VSAIVGSPLVLPALSGVLLVFGYAPFSVPLIPFVGLVPYFVWIDRPLPARDLLLGATAFAIPYLGGCLYWMFLLGRITPAGYAGALGTLLLHVTTYAIFPIGMGALNRAIRVPLVLSAPTLWVVSEHARTYGDLHFPWVTLGYSLEDWPSLAQHADLVGVYGLTLWLAVINASIASLVARRHEPRGRRLPAIVLAVAVAVPAAYNPIRWAAVGRAVAEAPRIRVAAVQPNVPQDLKWRPETMDAIYRDLNRLVHRAESDDVDLVVAPEAAIPLPIALDAARLPDDLEPGRKPLLVGALAGIGKGKVRRAGAREVVAYNRYYNAAFLASADRRVLAWQGKRHLVPIT